MAQILSINRRPAGNREARGGAKRWGSLIAGSSIAVWGATRRSPAGLALVAAGGLLAYSGIRKIAGDSVAHTNMVVNAKPQEVYNFWRNFENLPLFMKHLDNVSVTGERTSRWTAIGPLGTLVSWDADIVNERPNEEIRWRSLPGSDVKVDGAVRFSEAWGKRGTLVEVLTLVEAPGLGNFAAKVFGKDPSFMMKQDLRRLKALIETGEIPTVEGQSHGPRSAKIAAIRMANPDEPIRFRDAKIRDVFQAERGIA
jgi:uncharacterized membrane protein